MKHLITLSAPLVAVVKSSGITIDHESRSFMDELGRVRIFHGFNAVYKPFPFIP
jgi:hypothetical protein